ncbi:sigma-54-dependent Fis family transcriptional regulator [Mesoterricola silvestris]|uniref:ATPase AAA n=1 Tax=Mesoterricola silvestris TaxID=2927979 RepID=A0AA48K9Y6_9BACT|nr:sigma 54-interacting transcriptional regulator [Mesoterricola silvestris]BDU74464.1 ATPase AAA [Mesoterricola silvestris]
MAKAALDLARALKELALVAGRLPQGEAFLPAALDALAGIVPYDLAAVLRLEKGRLRVVCARGPLAGDPVRTHTLDLDRFPSIAEALRTGRTRVMDAHDHAEGDGDPYDGVLDLPHGHACMVVPLLGGGRMLGALTFDRATCGTFEPFTVSLATIYGQLIALTWMAQEQSADQRELLEAENRLLRSEVVGADDAGALMERSLSPAFRQVAGQARQVAASESAVLITGETGTGKEVLARAIHGWSRRAERPFLRLNCAALPEHLVESELFGHTRGAFSGASQARPGRFQVAHGGTLLLDEIGDLPLPMQSKLLRVLQEGTFEPLGSDRSVTVDVRILAATNVDLERAVAEGRFRADLFYRLNVFPLRLPPLRERREDILLLAEDWLFRQARRTGQGPWRIPPGDAARLEAHPWTGNVRELINVLERATILAPQGDLDLEAALRSAAPGPLPGPAPEDLRSVERDAILKALRQCAGRIYGAGGAALRLGLRPTTLQSRMKKLGIARTTLIS